MHLIIISGLEATGKSAIGKELAKRLECPYLSKDVIKEALFDAGGHSTWDYKWYEKRAKDQFFAAIKQLILTEPRAIVESNFVGADKHRLEDCLSSSVNISELFCTATGFTTLRRFVARNESGMRHKGHHDRRWYWQILLEDLLQFVGISWPSKPTGLTLHLLKINTTSFAEIDYNTIESFVKEYPL